MAAFAVRVSTSTLRGGDTLRGAAAGGVEPSPGVGGPIAFSGRDGELRFYSGDVPPKYLSIPFVQMNFAASPVQSRPIDPIVETIGGYVHLPEPGYEEGFFAPTPISFSCWGDDTTNSWKLRDALSNTDMDSPWRVGTQAWATAKGGGSVILSDGSFTATTDFYDTKKSAVDVEMLWSTRLSGAGSAWGVRCSEVYFPPQDDAVAESADFVEIRVRGLCYSSITAITSFTTGVSS